MVGDEAADAVRDAFIAAARHAGAAPSDDALPVWLYALARSECVRRGALVRKAEATPSADLLRRTLARLRPEHREALALTLETGEVARVLGVAPDTGELLAVAAAGASGGVRARQRARRADAGGAAQREAAPPDGVRLHPAATAARSGGVGT